MHFANEKVWLLGDSGYPLEPNLMVPFRIPPNQGGELYNKKQEAARATVERCIVMNLLSTESALHVHYLFTSKFFIDLISCFRCSQIAMAVPLY